MNDTRQALEKDVRDNLLLLYDFDKDYDVKLLKYSENVIFKITFKEAFPVVFRIHRPESPADKYTDVHFCEMHSLRSGLPVNGR